MDNLQLVKLSAIEARTGLEFSKYRSHELAETTADYLTFPALVIRTTIWSAMTCFATFVVGLVALYFAISGLLGVVVFGLLGANITVGWIFFRSLSLLLRRIESDLLKIGELGIAITSMAVQDIRQLATKTRSLELPSASDLFQGAMLGTLVPTVEGVVENKVPVFAAKLSAFLSNILCRISEKIGEVLESAEKSVKQALSTKTSGLLERGQSSEASSSEDDSARAERLDGWSESIESSLETVTAAQKNIVHATIGRARTVAGLGKSAFAILLAGSWAFIWYFFE